MHAWKSGLALEIFGLFICGHCFHQRIELCKSQFARFSKLNVPIDSLVLSPVKE